MDFIAGLVLDSDEKSRHLWAKIAKVEGERSLVGKSTDGSISLEIVIQNDRPTNTIDQLTIARNSVLLGTLFSNDSGDLVDTVKLCETTLLESVCQSGGVSFYDKYWGHYLGLFLDPETGDLTALRDPTGGRSLFFSHRSSANLFLFSNSLELLCKSLAGELSVDRKMIAMGLRYLNALPTRRTAFEQITSLLPGECMRVQAGSGVMTSDLPWWRTITSNPSSKLSIPESIEFAVRAWSSVNGKIALQLSGGLDSSGLLGMLAKLNRSERVHCLTGYRSSGITDERRYARIAANHVGASLTEFDMEDVRYPLSLSTPYRFSARPHAKVLFTQLDEAFDAHALAADCETYWIGFGGDTLFMNGPKAAVLVDALRNKGLKAAFQRAVEIALYEEKPLWRVAWEAGRSSSAREYKIWAECMRSPWTSEQDDFYELDRVGFNLIESCFSNIALAGQRNRFYDIYHDLWATSEQSYFFSAGGIRYCSPYYSEPVIEAAAAVPSYEMVNFGLNRFPQREFVGSVMPSEISGRVVKGGADDQVIRALLADADRIEDFLARGILVELGFVEPESLKVERRNIADRAFKNFNIVNMLASEIWLSGHRDILVPDSKDHQT